MLIWILWLGAAAATAKVVYDLLVWRDEIVKRERADALDRAMAETDE